MTTSVEQIIHETKALSLRVKQLFNDRQFDESKMSQYRYLLYVVHNEIDAFIQAIECLCGAHLGDHAEILLRTFFEIYITTKFLNIYPEYIDRYVSFAAYLKKQRFDDLKKYPDLFETPERMIELQESVEKDYDEIKDRYSFRGRKWYPKKYADIRAICKAIDDKEGRDTESRNYDIVYRSFCDFAHFNIMSMRRHEFHEDEQGYSFICHRSSREDILKGASSIALALFQNINNEYELGIGDDIEAVQWKLRTPSDC